MIKDGLWDPYNDFHMGNAAGELCAKNCDVSREAQDEFSVTSYKRALDAQQKGISTTKSSASTSRRRRGTPARRGRRGRQGELRQDPHAAAGLRKDGTVTAANASKINDGAAALVLTSAGDARASD